MTNVIFRNILDIMNPLELENPSPETKTDVPIRDGRDLFTALKLAGSIGFIAAGELTNEKLLAIPAIVLFMYATKDFTDDQSE